MTFSPKRGKVLLSGGNPDFGSEMNVETLIRQMHHRAGVGPETAPDADSLVGFFQSFRPNGAALRDLFDDLDVGEALHQRLMCLYQVAGEDRRPQGGRDAYFIVRRPPPLDPDLARQWGEAWLSGVRGFAIAVGSHEIAARLDPIPSVRVLQGIAPKHPKDDAEKSSLLLTLQQQAADFVERLDAGPFAPALRPAYYFTACDTMLRDYLMWPLYASASGLADPLEPYFQLWRHGVKYRIFGETQVDLYLPREYG